MPARVVAQSIERLQWGLGFLAEEGPDNLGDQGCSYAKLQWGLGFLAEEGAAFAEPSSARQASMGPRLLAEEGIGYGPTPARTGMASMGLAFSEKAPAVVVPWVLLFNGASAF